MKIYNTLTRKKEEFKPINANQVSIYSCGPTVYDYAHLGNLRTYLFTDILRRVLELDNYKVNQVVNITDVGHLTSDEDEGQDKMEKGAEREKSTVWEIAKKYEYSFFQDLKALNIEPAEKYPKATDNIQEQIEYIKKIEDKGFTYKTTDGIYFDTKKLPDYGKLTNQKVEEKAGDREIVKTEKKNPADFALWKFSPQDSKRQMEWDSPWGKGFPGWHIECSTMSEKYLGEQFDIHTGGIDHIPVHHNNEIAQAEAANGKNPANYFIHGEFLLIEGSKMAKSAGNFTTLKDLINKGYDPIDYRYLCLTAHYRSKLNFTWKGLEGAKSAIKNIRNLKNEKSNNNNDKKEEIIKQVTDALNNDLDTPKALAILHEAKNFTLWENFEPVFALNLKKKTIIPENIQKLSDERNEARKNNDYNKADEIRKEIEKEGYEVEDTSQGTKIS